MSMEQGLRRGLAIILSSPSGAGKSTMARRLMAWDTNLSFSVSATTRPPRAGEIDGEHYFFRNREVFGQLVLDGEMLEHAEVFGNHYGSPRAPVEAALSAGRDVIFDIDWQGGQQVRNSSLGRDVVSIFILPPSIAELERRLHERGQDAPEVIGARMAKSEAEISHWAEYDYVLVNDDADACETRLRTILTAERLRRDRQPWLSDFTRALTEEFRPERNMIYALDDVLPEIGEGVWVAPGANVIGRVALRENVSIWFGATLRGDNEALTIGAGSNIQDHCVMHSDIGFPCTLGENVTVGHKAMLHGCTIGDGTLIGMGATVLNGATIGRGCLIGAGALVTEGKTIPDGSLVMGAPGKVVRELDAAAREALLRSAEHYRQNAARFRAGLRIL